MKKEELEFLESKHPSLDDRLWAIVTELSDINEFDYPVRIPPLQEKADQIIEEFDPGPEAA